MRLLKKCEFLLRGDGDNAQHGSSLTKLEKYLEVLVAKVETIRRLITDGAQLQMSGEEVGSLSDRISVMCRKVSSARRRRETKVDGESKAHLDPSTRQLTAEKLPPGIVLLRAKPLGDMKVVPVKKAEAPTERTRAVNPLVAKRRRRLKARSQKGSGGGLTQAKMEDEKTKQDDLQKEILELTEELKCLQLKISGFFRQDEKNLEKAQKTIEDNFSRTIAEKKRLDMYSKTSSETCRTWSTLVFIGLSFTGTFVFIRLFPL